MEEKKEEIKTFKSKWEEKDEVCPVCNQITKRCRGLTRQNVRNLFRKPTLQDIIILLMIMLTLFGAWAYSQEVEQYKALINDPQEICAFYWSNLQHGNFDDRNTYDNLEGYIINSSGIPLQ